MASFGGTLPVPTQRMMLSEEALSNWFRLLWNMHAMQKALVPEWCLSQVEKDLCHGLHCFPRSDNNLVVGAMKVWALSRVLQTSATSVLPFAAIVNTVPAMDAFLDSVSYYVAGPVLRMELPLEFHRPVSLNLSSEQVELSEDGIRLLYATWHILLLREKIDRVAVTNPGHASFSSSDPNGKETDPYGKETDPNGKEPSLNFKELTLSTQDLTRLDAIQGCLELDAQDIYAQPSNANVFWRVKNCSQLAVEKTRIASHLFDFNPTTYADLFLGRAYLLSKKFKLRFCYGDEILWTPGRALWLWYDAAQKKISLTNNGTPELVLEANDAAIFYLHRILVHSV